MAAKQFNVNRFNDYGFVHSAWVNGELVEVARKEPTPPFAFVTADSLTNALAEARRLYGRMVVVSEPGVMQTITGVLAGAAPTLETNDER